MKALALKEAVKDMGAAVRKRKKVHKILGFLFTYVIFHLFYAVFLLALFKEAAIIELLNYRVIGIAVAIFFLQQVVDLTYDLIKGLKETNPEKLIEQSSFRLLPMHLTIMGIGFLGETVGLDVENPFMLILFLGLKTFADVGAYLYTRKGFSRKVDGIF